MTETIAEGLSVIGLVVGFPLLLLVLMLSLEQLESWGLRETPPETPVQAGASGFPDEATVDAAVDAMTSLDDADSAATGPVDAHKRA